MNLERFEMERQKKSNWCWAAVSVSVARFFDPATERQQCGVAGALRGLPCCSGFTKDCNRPEKLSRALTEVKRFDQIVEPTISFADLRKEINAGRPVCVRFEWQGGEFKSFGHFAAIRGYDDSGSEPVVIVDDPFYGRSRRLYRIILDSYQLARGKWTHTYLVNDR